MKYKTNNSEKQRKCNVDNGEKNDWNLNNLTSTISSISTNSSKFKKRDWVYRLYYKEIYKKKLENKIITLKRKSILTNANSSKQIKEIKFKENSKYDEYGNYKNINLENNFIINFLLSSKKNIKKIKPKKNSCLNAELNDNQRGKEENKMKLLRKYRKRNKNIFYSCNDELINEEDEEKEIDLEVK